MWVNIGDVVSVRVGPVRHVGIVTETGRIISNSRRRGGVFEESSATFAEGRTIKNHGPLSNSDPHSVLRRARALIGRPYDPVNFNCEHFVRFCYGRGLASPQKRWAIGAAAVAALIAIF